MLCLLVMKKHSQNNFGSSNHFGTQLNHMMAKRATSSLQKEYANAISKIPQQQLPKGCAWKLLLRTLSFVWNLQPCVITAPQPSMNVANCLNTAHSTSNISPHSALSTRCFPSQFLMWSRGVRGEVWAGSGGWRGWRVEGWTRYMKVGVKCTVVTSGAFKTIKRIQTACSCKLLIWCKFWWWEHTNG